MHYMLCMSKTSKMVFAAFMQHCIHSNVTHFTHVEDLCQILCTVLCIQWPIAPPGGKACTAFCLVELAVHHQSV